jgi:macrophage erythroblast attacher
MITPDLSIEYPYIRVPYDAGVRSFKTTKKHVEKEMSAILNTIITLKKDPSSNRDLAIGSLKNLLTRLQGLKKKLDDNYNDEEHSYECCKKRFINLNTLTLTDKQACAAYYKSRTNRLVVDHLLRKNYVETAQKIATEYNLNDFISIDGKILAEYRKVIIDLNNKSCESAMRWCQTNKSKLSRINSEFEFKLIFQEFIELVRQNNIQGALVFMKRYAETFQDNHIGDISKAMGCLTFYKMIDKFPQYKYYFDDARWTDLIELYKKESFYVMGISNQSGLEVTLQSGLCSLRTSNCFEKKLSKSHSCPICNPILQKMAAAVPSTHKIVSSLICRITGEIMDEHNPPVALPNGQVYSLKALKSMAERTRGKIVCPTTKDIFLYSQVIKIYIS